MIRLIEHLRKEHDPANLGEDAALYGKSRDTNPYRKGSSNYAWWDLGWHEVLDEDFGIMKEVIHV